MEQSKGNSEVEQYCWKSYGGTVKWNSNGRTVKVEQGSGTVMLEQ